MKVKLFFVIMFFCSTVLKSQLMPVGIQNENVTSLAVSDNSYFGKLILAGTESSGAYMHFLDLPDSSWNKFFFRNTTITSVYSQKLDSLYNKHFFAALRDSSGRLGLIHTNVFPIQSAILVEDSGLDRNRIEIIKSLAGFDYLQNGLPMPVFCCTNDPNIYKYSERQWTKVWQGPELVNINFVYAHDSTLWAGGAFNGFIVTPMLLRSGDYGASWDTLQLPVGEIYACHSLGVSPADNNIIFIGLNDLVLKSVDGGKTWNISLSAEQNVLFTGIVINPANPEQIIAGGKTSDNKMVLYESNNGGNTWSSVGQAVNCNCIIAGINALMGTFVNDQFTIYIGTAGNGVWKYSNGVTSSTEMPVFPKSCNLFQNFPNPFNPSTLIQYEINERQFVTLKIYDLLGREIATLVNEEKQSGRYSVGFNAQQSAINHKLSSGIYFYRITSGNFSMVKKMVLLR